MLFRLLFSPLRLAVALAALSVVLLVHTVRFAFTGEWDLRILWRNVGRYVLTGFKDHAESDPRRLRLLRLRQARMGLKNR